MTTKAVYLSVSGKEEQVEFSSEDNADDILDTFRSVAETGPNDILKLLNKEGFYIQISPNTPQNTPEDRYKLEVVARVWGDEIPEHTKRQWENIEKRLSTLENLVLYQTTMPKCVEEILTKMNNVKNKNIGYLSWLGLYKDLPKAKTVVPLWDRYKKKDETVKQSMIDKFKKITQSQFSSSVSDYLKEPSFDNWQWDEAEMMLLLQSMFIELDILSKFGITLSALQTWLCEVYLHYFDVPFHNFKHCFMVAQMMYCLIWHLELCSLLAEEEILTLLVSAICHDLEHSGFNNIYHVNAHTILARTYNDRSPLENHHCDVAFRILEKTDLLKNLSPQQYTIVRQGIIRCILSTDMAKHNNILHDFETALVNFDIDKKEHRMQLMSMLIKVADISNELRPPTVAEPWLDCLLNEFFAQSDTEKLEGLPVTSFMDRDTHVKSRSQVHFIANVLMPLVKALCQCFPKAMNLLAPAESALSYYENQFQEYEQNMKKNPTKKTQS
ncbi:affinity cGMP-specific 3 3' [Octopus vulgaris]|uniref:Phosphodiesterase n=2 Tax=Octopus vulgaris TaxID=6645 RepID=A0AA36B644_OCTVU|nr:affinity cGMP-specific 3 3' [Octopus vulgaris]